ncbi:uncharacterized protein G2W53_022402 [Senna tora]|uniref:Uncharacterized protein n=1 Tax=Senna tora TaxID=362788 RepID=A0A834TL66_9FABA|nr:uncharacterized protein G2W53_022402 [Senna tora]
MANPSGNHQEQTHVSSSFNGVSGGANPTNGNSVPESSSAAVAMKHNPGISLDWTPDEQAILEEGLAKIALNSCFLSYPFELFDMSLERFTSESNILRYAKIALQLQNKTVRDVALRVRWMNKKENSKRRKDDLTRKSKDKKLNLINPRPTNNTRERKASTGDTTATLKERVSDPSAKTSHFATRPNVSPYAPPMIMMDNDDGISYKGPTGELLEQNAQALNQISANLAAFQLCRFGALGRFLLDVLCPIFPLLEFDGPDPGPSIHVVGPCVWA